MAKVNLIHPDVLKNPATSYAIHRWIKTLDFEVRDEEWKVVEKPNMAYLLAPFVEPPHTDDYPDLRDDDVIEGIYLETEVLAKKRDLLRPNVRSLTIASVVHGERIVSFSEPGVSNPDGDYLRPNLDGLVKINGVGNRAKTIYNLDRLGEWIDRSGHEVYRVVAAPIVTEFSDLLEFRVSEVRKASR